MTFATVGALLTVRSMPMPTLNNRNCILFESSFKTARNHPSSGIKLPLLSVDGVLDVASICQVELWFFCRTGRAIGSSANESKDNSAGGTASALFNRTDCFLNEEFVFGFTLQPHTDRRAVKSTYNLDTNGVYRRIRLDFVLAGGSRWTLIFSDWSPFSSPAGSIGTNLSANRLASAIHSSSAKM